ARSEVDGGPRRGRSDGLGGRRVVCAERDPRGGAALRGEVALGAGLHVALEHETARDAELAGQRARRGETLAGPKPAPGDRPAQPSLDRGAERLRALPVEPQQQLGAQTGPLDRHGTGPYYWTASGVACPSLAAAERKETCLHSPTFRLDLGRLREA